VDEPAPMDRMRCSTRGRTIFELRVFLWWIVADCGETRGDGWQKKERPACRCSRNGLSRHADNTDPSRAQYLRPYLVRAVRRTV